MTKRKSLCRHSYTTWKTIHPSFFGKSMVRGGRPLLPEILGQTDPVGERTPIFNQYSVVAPQPWHLAKKSSIITNKKSTTRFPVSLRWTSYVVSKPAKRELKNAKRPFHSCVKFHFIWRKPATKLLYVNTASDIALRHSRSYLSMQKWFAGDVSDYVKICPKLTHLPLEKRRLSIDFRS